MKLAISNIAWEAAEDERIYGLMEEYGYSGLEIAPTRIFPEHPYDKLTEAGAWSEELKRRHGFTVPSMQSIWFGRQEKLFGSGEEREILAAYTRKAIDFAAVVGCKNLVFGCPRNRNFPEGASQDTAVAFFREIGAYAAEKGTVIGMEANPPIYNTNYINDTVSALELIRQVDSPGFLLNLDLGTVIHNQEDIAELEGQVRYINHVHISEPGLKEIQKRSIHEELKALLEKENYAGYISIEMGKGENTLALERAAEYVQGIF
ncbi:sugar phosphate isomerase/epimerase [Lachnospiraceae bacterium]|nr:sugar phosphate isomerase/epimerase [Lachnospiraceae bacterium]